MFALLLPVSNEIIGRAVGANMWGQKSYLDFPCYHCVVGMAV